MNIKNKHVVIYQAPNGAMEVRLDKDIDTVLLTQKQVGQLFNVQKAAISKHLKNIFDSGELDKKSTVSILETVQTEGKRRIARKIEYYNLDLILSVGYRVNSVNATKFRQWATKILREHIIKGYTINKSRIAKNYQQFIRAVDSIKKLLPQGTLETKEAKDIIELIRVFGDTWFSLDAYDRSSLPKAGINKKAVEITAEELSEAIFQLKEQLGSKKEASTLFAMERHEGALSSIVGNVFQSFGGRDLYPSVEEKAAHLLYFIAKGHPFTDGNKRSGAFSFVWFLNRAGLLNITHLNSEALTALTLLVAESKPADKDRMIGLIVLLISTRQ